MSHNVTRVTAGCLVPAPQTLVTDQHEEMADTKEDGTPMPLAHYSIGDGSHITLRIHVRACGTVAAHALFVSALLLQQLVACAQTMLSKPGGRLAVQHVTRAAGRPRMVPANGMSQSQVEHTHRATLVIA